MSNFGKSAYFLNFISVIVPILDITKVIMICKTESVILS